MAQHWFTWNPDPTAFTVPFIEHPVRWYGVCFAIGFFVGYHLWQRMIGALLQERDQDPAIARRWADSLLWYIVLGTLVGARLGHVLFYELHIYLQHPLEILKVWNGGLASHGGTIGVLLAAWLAVRVCRREQKWFSYPYLLDTMAWPTAFVACCIRIGNFINQEIVGKVTDMPWAVVFGSPYESAVIAPRHPTQLYEVGCYLVTFLVLGGVWKWRRQWFGTLLPTGIFFLLVFGTRFFVEPLKEVIPGSSADDLMTTAQMLSIPFVILGLSLMAVGRRRLVRA